MSIKDCLSSLGPELTERGTREQDHRGMTLCLVLEFALFDLRARSTTEVRRQVHCEDYSGIPVLATQYLRVQSLGVSREQTRSTDVAWRGRSGRQYRCEREMRFCPHPTSRRA